MTPFLHRIAQIFYSEFGSGLYKHTFVFPNRRAGVFFQKYLADIAGKPVFSPKIITIQELFESLSAYRIADKIEMLVMLYEKYIDISRSEELFDDFLYWGEMLLNDFNDVDKHLVDAAQLFKNVQNLKSLDSDMSYLSETQIQAIRRFWTNFMPAEGNKTKEKFQETWQILVSLYDTFRTALHEKGCAYEGMLFREVAERAKAGAGFDLPSHIVFVGLNALTPSETALLQHLKNVGVADFYWDYDSPQVRDPHNRASLWVKENLQRFPSKFSFNNSEEQVGEKPLIELIGIPSGVGQAKHVTQILSRLVQENDIANPSEAIKTAIVLPDENLLLPVLYSIPQEIEKINVTMGYGLRHSSVASLVDNLADLQRNLRKSGGETVFYYRFVQTLLNHPLIVLSAKAESEALKTHILTHNRVMIAESEIPQHPLLRLIFTPVSQWKEIPDYLQSILSSLYNRLTEEKQTEKETGNDAQSADLEREFIVQYYKTVTRLSDTLGNANHLSVETYFRLLKCLSQNISVSFSGEPLSGLQVMGVLETRVIDFENLILLSMNEGVFPLKNPSNSFIPYTLRKGFGLHTYEHQDSTYAYHFYRMISRAKRVFMLYDTRAEELQTGEVSRYFYQLKYLYNDYFDISERVAAYDVSAPEIPPVAVTKTAAVMAKLSDFTGGGASFLSASLINNYINCPLQFYFTAVEGLSEESEVQESVEADVFGTIFHKLMEMIYNRYKAQTVTPDVLSGIAKNDAYLTELIEKAFARYYFKDEKNPRPLQGQHHLIGEIIRSYVKHTLAVDRQFTPFEYFDSEYRFVAQYPVNNALTVNFKGSIDRIDRVGEALRIIDYKTGAGATDFKNIEQLFDASKNNRPYQILQVFVYALFYARENSGRQISPAIYYLRSVFKDFNPTVTCEKAPVENVLRFLPEFTEYFNSLLAEIFNPEIPFAQTKNEKNCAYCAFKQICGR